MEKSSENYVPFIPRGNVGVMHGAFSWREVMLICNIAASYAEEGDFEQSIALLRKVGTYFDNMSLDSEERMVSEVLYLLTLSKTLGRQGSYDEALKTGAKGVEICLNTKSGKNLALLLYEMTKNLELKNEDEKICKVRLRQAFIAAKLNDDQKLMEHIKLHWEELYKTPFLL